jgi:hypothetical protein
MNGFLVLNFYRAGETEPATLEYLIRDYIGHMETSPAANLRRRLHAHITCGRASLSFQSFDLRASAV